MQSPALFARLGLVSLALAWVPAHGARKDKEKAPARRGMLMPDLHMVLGDAWTVPPELSDRAQPGTVLEVTDSGYRTVKTGCVRATANRNPLTNVSMQNSLSGGVSFGAGQGSASARQGMHLSFVGPEIISFELVDFIPSDECVAALDRYARRGSITGLVIVQEALMARVNGCEQTAATARVALPGASMGIAAGGACQMFSDAPVAVGVKTVPLSQIPEMSGLGKGSTTPQARTSPAPRPAPPRSSSAPSTSSRSSSAQGQTKWTSYPLRGHDNDVAAFGQVSVTRRSDGSLRMHIANQFLWDCGLEVDANGSPTRLVNCTSGDPGWGAAERTIPLRCRVRRNDELCTGSYTLTHGDSYSSPCTMQLSRALDRSASWPW